MILYNLLQVRDKNYLELHNNYDIIYKKAKVIIIYICKYKNALSRSRIDCQQRRYVRINAN